MGWISDILLARFVRKQYEEMSMMPETVIEREPTAYHGKDVASYEDLKQINKKNEKARNIYETKLEVKKPINKEKLDDLETAMEEIRQHIANRGSENLSEGKIKELENKIRHLQKLNSAKDNHINILNKELEKSKELSPSTKNYISFLQDQAENKSVKTATKAQTQDKSMAVSK